MTPVLESTVGPVYSEPIERLLAHLGVDARRGLAEEEAARRLVRDGPNELPAPRRKGALAQLFEQFTNPLVATLLGAAVIALVTGYGRRGASSLVRYGDATAIFLIVVLNAALGFFQERRAEAVLASLEKLQTPTARVLRGDKVIALAAPQLVVGDVLELEAGDAVPADARLLETTHLVAEESALTGESVPVMKDARDIVAADAPLGDRTTMIFIGTTLVRGKGRGVVVATGARTELGRLSTLLARERNRVSPLEQKLGVFANRVLWASIALSAILFARGAVRGHRRWDELLLEAVSLAVAAIPEGLPAITTITLALGMQRLAKRGAILRKLTAVETLGAATVICTDKTGTLTRNEMTVRHVFAGGVNYEVTGEGYDPRGDVLDPTRTRVEGPTGALGELLATSALCNNATLRHRDGVWSIEGDPTEAALLTLATKAGISPEAVTSSHQVLGEIPFDGERKRMTVIAIDAGGHEVAHSKGSADALLPRCAAYLDGRGRVALDDASRQAILREADRMSSRALRVIAIARRDLDRGTASRSVAVGDTDGVARASSEIETRLTFLGLVAMADPAREGARDAVRRCVEAHVRAVMITGDHKLTAMAIAKDLGLWEEARDGRAGSLAITGSELEGFSDAQLDAVVDRVSVFARVTAEQKLRIVAAFKRGGHIVAMTGDGVNDAPALREAHIGIAMGKGGTDVAREAADLVIADDDFATIVEAVREGRAIWNNIQKFVFFLLSSNAGLLVAVFAVGFLTDLEPLTPLMILWINLVTNGLPALALGVDPPEPLQMRQPPRRRSAELLSRRDWVRIGVVGVWMGATAMVCYLAPFGHEAAQALPHGRALAFSLLALSPLFHAYNCRSATVSIARIRPRISWPLLGATLASGAIHLVAVLVPALRPVFHTFAIAVPEWALLLVLSASIVPVIESLKWADRRDDARRRALAATA